MATGFRKFLEGLRIIPKSSSTASEAGDLDVTSSSGKLNYHNGTSSSPVVTEDHSATLTNKTLDAAESINGLSFNGSTSGSVTVEAAATTTPYTVILPDVQGAADTVLVNDGAGNLSWGTGGAFLPLAGGTMSGGINLNGNNLSNVLNVTGTTLGELNIQAQNSFALNLSSSGSANIQVTPTSIEMGSDVTLNNFNLQDVASLQFLGSNSGELTIQAPATVSTHTLTLPDAQGAADTVLTNDGSGNLTWEAAAVTGANTSLSNLTSPTAINQDLTFASGNYISSPSGFGFTIGASTSGSTFNVTSDVASTITSLSDSIYLNATSGSLIVNTQFGVSLNNRPINDVGGLFFKQSPLNGPIIVQPPAITTGYTLNLPSAQGAANTFLRNDGSGNLSWSNASSQINLSGSNASVAIGSPVYIDSSGNAQLIDAADDSKVTFVGISLNVGGGPIVVQVSGEVTIPSASFTRGDLVYVNPLIPGAYTQTVPSNAGQWVIPVGTATATNKIAINASGSVAIVKITSEVDPYVYANVTSVSSNTTLTNGNSIVLATGGVGGITVTLPAPTSGKIFNIKKVDAGVGVITISPPSGTIDGAASKTVTSQYDSLTITSDGTNFFII
jgi:hypothetical protein